MHCSLPHPTVAALILALATCEGPTDPGPRQAGADPLLSVSPGHTWGAAVSVDPDGLANINTAALEGCPSESPDGLSLYFVSTRDGPFDLWVSRRAGRGSPWQQPEKLPAPVNSAFTDQCPSPMPDGSLLFVSTRPGGCGGADLWLTRLHPTLGWQDPENLGCTVNSAGNEFSPSYTGAGGGMLFFSSSRAGQDDIWMSLRLPTGGWGAPAPVAELNTPGFNTVRPNVSQDGREIVFDSNRPGGLGLNDVWYATRMNITHTWHAAVNMGANVNSSSTETRAFVSSDGERLYFGSSRPGGRGSLDVYVSRRP